MSASTSLGMSRTVAPPLGVDLFEPTAELGLHAGDAAGLLGGQVVLLTRIGLDVEQLRRSGWRYLARRLGRSRDRGPPAGVDRQVNVGGEVHRRDLHGLIDR